MPLPSVIITQQRGLLEAKAGIQAPRRAIVLFYLGAAGLETVARHPGESGEDQPFGEALSARSRMYRERIEPRPTCTPIASLKPAGGGVAVGGDQPKGVGVA